MHLLLCSPGLDPAAVWVARECHGACSCVTGGMLTGEDFQLFNLLLYFPIFFKLWIS